jgi:hypothetical protein
MARGPTQPIKPSRSIQAIKNNPWSSQAWESKDRRGRWLWQQSINQSINQSSKQASKQLIAQESSQSIINPLTIKCGVTKGRKAKPSCLSINNHIHRSQALEFTATNDTNQCPMPTGLLTCLTAFLFCRKLPHPTQQAHC